MAKNELNLWGEPFENHQRSTPFPIGLDFDGSDVRMLLINGEPWWVAADVCRVLEHTDPSKAVSRLDDDERGTNSIRTPSGDQQMLIINESGLYSLIFTSRKPEAKRFKRWVTQEVLPAIRKGGSYSLISSPVSREAKRLHSDNLTAIKRIENKQVNKSSHARIKAENGCPNDYKAFHNSRYRGLTGLDAKALRHELGIKGRRSPLDFSSMLIIAQNSHASALAERLIEEAKTPLAGQPDLVEKVAREMVEADAAKFGDKHQIGFRNDPRRGRIIDVIPKQITSA